MKFFQGDAFADRPFAGNPAAVMTLREWLPEQMLASIAAEHNLAETAYFVPQGRDFHLRWFTPTVEMPTPGSNAGKINGRDHNHWGFSVWLAGGGIKGGMAYGATDEFGYKAVEKRVHPHDLHATMLHLMGIDHEKLTYRYAGRDFRLTDVHGKVVREILA